MKSDSPDYVQLSEDYRRVEQAILFLEANYHQQPGLAAIAASVNLSEYHFQRLFTRWVGISPKRFLQYITKESAKQLLERSKSLLDVTYASGLSGPGRLHDLFVTCEAVTPGEYKQRGAGLAIRYGLHPTLFGECLLAVTERGICNLSFVSHGNGAEALAAFQHRWQSADLTNEPDTTRPLIERIFNPHVQNELPPLQLYLSGTNFQIKVWEALLHIPPGYVVSYENIASSLGMPRATRAVGSAVGRNPIAYLIPCHRVIRTGGDFGSYLYGSARKKILLAWEQTQNVASQEEV